MSTAKTIGFISTGAALDAALAQSAADRAAVTAIKAEIIALLASANTAGKSAYQLAVDNGYSGTVTQWLASLVGAPGIPVLSATSTTSLSVGTGAKSLTIQAGRSYGAGTTLRLTSTDTPTTYMAGTVTSYNATTGALVMNITESNGPATAVAAWTIGLTGLRGATGNDGIVDYATLVNLGGLIVITYNGTAWPSRASKVPAGFTGLVWWYSEPYPAAARPTDMATNDDWITAGA